MDQESPYQMDAMILSRALPFRASPRKPLSCLLSNPNIVNDCVRTIRSCFESDGYTASLCSLSDYPSTSTNIVSLLDIDTFMPFFQDLSEKDFNALTRLVTRSASRGNKILWLTGPAQVSTQNPYHGMVLGLARTIRLELGSVFATLELDTHESSSLHWDSLVQVFRKLEASDNLVYNRTDCEFALVDGNVCIPRYTPSHIDDLLRYSLADTQVAKRLSTSHPGSLNNLQWGLESRSSILQDNDIEVEVRSTSLNSWVNRSFLLHPCCIIANWAPGLQCDHGKYGKDTGEPESRFGVCWCDMPCRCTRKSEIPTGRFGALLASRLSSNHIMVDANYCVKLPDNLPFHEAVSLPTVHASMIRGLLEICGLERGESVLIHGVGGTDGIAGIQIARTIGAEVGGYSMPFHTSTTVKLTIAKIFVTTATDEEKELLETNYGIPWSRIFSSEDNAFISAVLQKTDSRGVDVVVSTCSNELFMESWKCLAEGGTMIDLDPNSNEHFDRSHFGGNRNFCSFDIVTLFQQKPMMAQRSVKFNFRGLVCPIHLTMLINVSFYRLLQTVLELYKDGSIKPISPLARFSPSEVKEDFITSMTVGALEQRASIFRKTRQHFKPTSLRRKHASALIAHIY